MAKRREHVEKELEITTLLNVMVVLISFLLLTAVFSQITIQELKLPSQGGGDGSRAKPATVIEVVVRKNSLQIGNGKTVLESIPNTNNQYNFKKLSESLLKLKLENKDKEDIAVLLEPDIEYESLISVMDAVKIAEVFTAGQQKPKKTVLFPQVSIGDAP